MFKFIIYIHFFLYSLLSSYFCMCIPGLSCHEPDVRALRPLHYLHTKCDLSMCLKNFSASWSHVRTKIFDVMLFDFSILHAVN